MTTLSEREKALEAHFASVELAHFRERLQSCAALGLRLATGAGLQGSEADTFAIRFAEHCAVEPPDGDIYDRLAAMLSERGVTVTPDQVRELALAGEAERGLKATQPHESWVAFVTTELMSLFHGEAPTGRSAGEKPAVA